MTEEHKYPCELLDIDTAISEVRNTLAKLKTEAEDKTAHWKGYGTRCKDAADQLLKSLEDSIAEVFEEELKKVNDKERTEEESINQKADEEIEKINQIRTEKLEENRKSAESQRTPIKAKQLALMNDVKNISERTRVMLEELQKQSVEISCAIKKAGQRIDTEQEKEDDFINGSCALIKSLTDVVEKTTTGYANGYVTMTLPGISFEEGTWKEKYNGRIVGYRGKYEVVDTIGIAEYSKHPAIVGRLNDEEIILTCIGGSWKEHAYTLNLKTKDIRSMDIGADTCLASCAMLDPNTLVYGRYQEYNSPINVSFYNMNNKQITNIKIPKTTSYDNTRLDVGVDKDGRLVVLDTGSCFIHVISSGKITGAIRSSDPLRMLGVLSSGDIIARHSPSSDKLLIFKNGNRREVILSGKVWCCGIHPVTDDLYPLYWNDAHQTYVIDHLSSKGEVKGRDLVISPMEPEFCDEGDYSMQWARLEVTATGKLVICNGRKIIVYGEHHPMNNAK